MTSVHRDPRHPFYWHAFFLAVTMSFTEVNTVMPALVMKAGGSLFAVGALTAIMLGLPLVSQLLFAGFLSTRERKKPFLLLGINLRVVALAGAAYGIAAFGTDVRVIGVVFIAMTVFALSGAFAGVSYTALVGTLVHSTQRRSFFVRRQVITTLGLLLSALLVRFLLGAAAFPDGYVLLFALASGFLFVASLGFWALAEPAASTPGASRGTTMAALRQAPQLLREDPNLRALIGVANLAALGFTSIPLITALAYRSFELSASAVGTFVVIQIIGMLISSPVWNRLIRAGGFRLVLRAELALIATLFPLALILAQSAPLPAYAALYLLAGAIVAAQKIAIDGVLVQISPNDRRALYAGVFGAANLGAAVLPLLTGAVAGAVGFTWVFLGASVVALLALLPLRGLSCGDWYHEA
ncbi:MAG: MFS transporter [Intrasporangiaceae bacterium]|nr:MFS transporter [Intrasporangiaceae bacterium]